MQSSSLPTVKYQFALPYALHAISPALAALHASRARLLHYPDPVCDILAASHCIRCGTYLLDGSGEIRTVREPPKKKRRTSTGQDAKRMLRRTCGVCSYQNDTPIERGNASAFPRVRRRKNAARDPSLQATAVSLSKKPQGPEQRAARLTSQTPAPKLKSSTPVPSKAASPAPTMHVDQSRSSTPSASSSTTATPTRQKSRPKKKSGLQDMLARNRERQEQEKKQSQSLSAFLEGL
ncbi:hypothetical protein K474DRAFT_1768354 [Panus rudis PR-1116 ss-1]|nr:hypothetical protein K474DRAFT_1768354 [Panus rudis PR-1116 ss-1]